MVALIDDLQLKGVVQRRQDPDDRRRNVVELTDAGRGTVREAAETVGKAERAFLARPPRPRSSSRRCAHC